MATAAHCAYCFEVLSASLEKRKPLSLPTVEALWEKYEASDEEDVEDLSHPEELEDEMQIDSGVPAAPAENPATYKPAAISRLLAPSPSSTSSTSIPSATSSTPSLSTNASSAASKSSSRSSFFSSLPRRLGSGRRKSPRLSSEEEYPLFVTWNTLSRSGNKSLRGCIGTFEAQELDDGLRSYALTSAFEDSRFLPITYRELSSLKCGVTLLTDFETVSNPMNWDIGKHGLRISFTWNGRRYGATYLPDVAREQGWSKDETIISLMRKAGWAGRREDWRSVKDLAVVRYQGKKATLGYRAWREWRDWVEETGHDEQDC